MQNQHGPVYNRLFRKHAEKIQFPPENAQIRTIHEQHTWTEIKPATEKPDTSFILRGLQLWITDAITV